MNGTITHIMVDGSNVEVYIPDNVTRDTKVLVYEHGTGDHPRDWGVFKERFASEGVNAIVVRDLWSYSNHSIKSNADGAINQILSTYNLKPSNVIFDGFSAGGVAAYKGAIEHIKNYPGQVKNPIIAMNDGWLKHNMPTADEIQILKDNNAVVVAFSQDSNGYIRWYKELAKQGVNVLVAADHKLIGNHRGVNDSFIYNGLIDFITDNRIMPSGYKFLVYNDETGKMENIDSLAITNCASIYNLFGISTEPTSNLKSFFSRFRLFDIRSDRGTLEGYLGDIKGEIDGTKFFNGGLESFSGESTTNVPMMVPDAVKKHFSSTVDILNRINELSNSIRQIDESYQETDKKLTQEVSERFNRNN